MKVITIVAVAVFLLLSVIELGDIFLMPHVKFIDKDYSNDGIYVCSWEAKNLKMTCIRTGLKLPADPAEPVVEDVPNVQL